MTNRWELLGRPTKEMTGTKDLEILMRLAFKGPLNCNQISIENYHVIIPYPTVRRRLKADRDSLLKKGMVSGVRNTKPRKYTLTPVGLLKLLSRYSEKMKGRMDQIACRWGSLLPPPFQKWSYLKTKGLEGQMIEITKGLGWMFPRLSEKYLDYAARAVFFHILFVDGASEIKLAWYKALRDDPDLKEWAITNIKDDINAIRDWKGVYEQVLQIIEAPKEPVLDDLKAVLKIPFVPSIVIMPLIAAQIAPHEERVP